MDRMEAAETPENGWAGSPSPPGSKAKSRVLDRIYRMDRMEQPEESETTEKRENGWDGFAETAGIESQKPGALGQNAQPFEAAKCDFKSGFQGRNSRP